MRRCTMIVLWMLAFAAGMPAWAGLPETPHPRQFTVANGLPSNRINGIAEDQHGYLWIATSDGLARYDGIDFRIWRVEQGLRDNFVWSVHVDARNRVWIGTRQAGVAMLDASRSRFRYFNRATPPSSPATTCGPSRRRRTAPSGSARPMLACTVSRLTTR